MFGFLWVYSDTSAPGVEYPVIIEQFLGTNGLGNGGSSAFPHDIEAMQELSTVAVLHADYHSTTEKPPPLFFTACMAISSASGPSSFLARGN